MFTHLSDNPLFQSPLDAIDVPFGHFAWCHLGQQGYLLKLGETIIACDPYLSPSPKRLVPPQMTLDQFHPVSMVLGTHDHTDHIDRDAWKRLIRIHSFLYFLLPAECHDAVSKAIGLSEGHLHGLEDGESTEVNGITIHAIAAAHETLSRNPVTGNHPSLMYVIEGNGVRILHAGDTCLYDGMVRRLRRFMPLTAVMLPINGRDAERLGRGCIGNMTYQEAADLAGLLQPALTLPGHFDMFPGNTEDPNRFLSYFQLKYPWLNAAIPVPGQVNLFTPPDLPPACIPTPRLEDDCYDWHERHRRKLEEAHAGNHDIILIGDSITHFWETTHGPESYQKLFGGRSVLNLGFGWDRTCNVLWRLRNGEFANQRPRLAVIHIGTNNLTRTPNYPGDTPEQTFQGIRAIIDELLRQSPDTHIILMCVFPRGLNHEPYRKPISELNELLRQRLSNRYEITLVDLTPSLMLHGELNTTLFRDNCHLNEDGYAVWAKRLQPLLDR